MNSEFLNLQVAAIASSPTNPRKHFNEEKLQELADSIKAGGVHTPVLTRPLPGSRVPDTDKSVTHELVAGERRWRASKLAGVATIPAIVKDLTDAQVLEIQLIENLQRDDLTELEEAEGYQQLIDATGVAKEDIGAKISKGRSYVYNRLALLKACPVVKEALRTRKVEYSVAHLLATHISNHALQEKALKDILKGSQRWSDNTYVTEPMSYRAAADLVRRHYMLDLKKAVFKIKDASLVEGVPDCMSCSKRTGANPELHPDTKNSDVCTDPQCFHQKEEAHARLQEQEAKARGQVLIAGEKAEELANSGYGHGTPSFKGYKRLDVKEDSPTDQPLRAIIGKAMQAEGILPVLIANPNKTGEMVPCLPNDVVSRLLKLVQQEVAKKAAAGQATNKADKAVQELIDAKEAKAEKQREAKFEQAWRDALMAALWTELKARTADPLPAAPFDIEVHRLLLERSINNLRQEDTDRICKALGMNKEVGQQYSLYEYADGERRPDLLHLLVIAGRDSAAQSMYSLNVENEDMMLVCTATFGKTALKSLITKLKAEAKADVFGKPEKKAPIAIAPAAQASGVRGKTKDEKSNAPAARPTKKGKLTPEEARKGIATAMLRVEAASAAVAAVAPAVQPVQAWPFPVRAEDKQGVAIAPQDKSKASTPVYAKSGQQSDDQAAQDPLFAKALKAIKKAKSATVRLLKSELGISSERAMTILSELETAGHLASSVTGRGKQFSLKP